MAVKLTSLKSLKKIPIWVNLSACVSSLSNANRIEIFQENNQNPLNLSEFESNIHFLRNKLVPDRLIHVLDNMSDLNSAVKVFKWAASQKGFCHTVDTYYRMILKLGMAGNILEMERIVSDMVKDKCPGVEEGLVSLIGWFVKQNRLSEANRVLASMNSGGYKPSIEIINVVMGGLVGGKRDFRDVMFVYKEMVKGGIIPTVDTLNYLLEALFEADRVECALDQFRRIYKKGCSPNSRTFQIVIKGLIVKDRMEEAAMILGEIFELDCQLEVSFYACIIPLFCRGNKLEEGMKLFQMMRASNFLPDSVMCGDLIRCLCKKFRLDDAVNLFEEMIQRGGMLSEDVVVDIINGFCKLGRINEALTFLEDKNVSETSPQNALLEGCCNAGKFLVAIQLLESMFQRNIADCNSWNILIRCFCENVGIKKASELLSRMIISSLDPDCATYSALVVGHCKFSKHEDALELFRHVCAKFWVLDSIAYTELIEGLCWIGKSLEAAEVFRYMSRNGSSLQSSSFNMLIKSICDIGKVDEAIRLRAMAYSSGTFCSNMPYTTIMLELSKSGKAKDILIVISQMLVEGCTLDVESYCILMQSMSSLNQTKECALVFNMMVKEGLTPYSETMYNLLLGLANHSQLHLISNVIDELVSGCEILNSAMFNLLINGLWKEGYKSEARRLLDLMLEKGWVPDAKTHGVMMGSNVKEETYGLTSVYEHSTSEDNVSNILAEGLIET